MCDKAILENGGTLKSVSNYYKNQERCNKAVGNYRMRQNLFLNAIRVKKMCDKAVHTYPSTLKVVPEYCKT